MSDWGVWVFLLKRSSFFEREMISSEFLGGRCGISILSFLDVKGVLFKEWRTCSSWAWSGVGGLLRLCWGKKKRGMVSRGCHLIDGRKGVFGGEKTHLIASSKTLLRFLCVRAEHSRYLTALISLATCTACSYCMGCILRWRSCSLTSGSSRKSSLVPTRMIGTPGAWCSISGYHCRKDYRQ